MASVSTEFMIGLIRVTVPVSPPINCESLFFSVIWCFLSYVPYIAANSFNSCWNAEYGVILNCDLNELLRHVMLRLLKSV